MDNREPPVTQAPPPPSSTSDEVADVAGDEAGLGRKTRRSRRSIRVVSEYPSLLPRDTIPEPPDLLLGDADSEVSAEATDLAALLDPFAPGSLENAFEDLTPAPIPLVAIATPSSERAAQAATVRPTAPESTQAATPPMTPPAMPSLPPPDEHGSMRVVRRRIRKLGADGAASPGEGASSVFPPRRESEPEITVTITEHHDSLRPISIPPESVSEVVVSNPPPRKPPSIPPPPPAAARTVPPPAPADAPAAVTPVTAAPVTVAPATAAPVTVAPDLATSSEDRETVRAQRRASTPPPPPAPALRGSIAPGTVPVPVQPVAPAAIAPSSSAQPAPVAVSAAPALPAPAVTPQLTTSVAPPQLTASMAPPPSQLTTPAIPPPPAVMNAGPQVEEGDGVEISLEEATDLHHDLRDPSLAMLDQLAEEPVRSSDAESRASRGSSLPPPPPGETSRAVRGKPPTPPMPVRAQATAAPEARKRRRLWWEELFNEDYFRTMERLDVNQMRAECDWIENALGVEAGAQILDVACGAGRQAVELARRRYNVTGVDLSPAMIARAAEQAVDAEVVVQLVQGDMSSMEFSESFDAAFLVGSSFGYFDDERNAEVAQRIHRALKPHGTFLLAVLNRDHVIQRQPAMSWFEGDGCVCMEETSFNYITSRLNVKRTIIFDDGRQREIEYSLRLYSLHELGQVLHRAGFRILEVSGHTRAPGAFFGASSRELIILAQRRGGEVVDLAASSFPSMQSDNGDVTRS